MSTTIKSKFGFGLACALAIALAACGGDEAAAPAAQTAAKPAAPAATPAAPAPQVAQMPVPDLLKAANLAVAENRLVSPPANNAIEYYLAVLDQDKNNVQATQALVDVFPLAASIAERAVADRQLDDADRIVALLDRASPNSYTVTTIRTKLETARQTATREEERRLAAETAAAQAATQAAAAPQAAPANPTPPPAPTPAPVAEPEPAAPAAAQVASTSPPPAQSQPTPPPAPSSETRDAELVRAVQPEYPTAAARKRTEGWVELQFTVGTDGRVKNVSVARAQPARVFDREAIRAMQQWTFRPAVRNGAPVETTRRQRMQFSLGG